MSQEVKLRQRCVLNYTVQAYVCLWMKKGVRIALMTETVKRDCISGNIHLQDLQGIRIIDCNVYTVGVLVWLLHVIFQESFA